MKKDIGETLVIGRMHTLLWLVTIITISFYEGMLAQLVEQWIEAPCVGSSILSHAINLISLRIIISDKFRTFSSVGQSIRLITERS